EACPVQGIHLIICSRSHRDSIDYAIDHQIPGSNSPLNSEMLVGPYVIPSMSSLLVLDRPEEYGFITIWALGKLSSYTRMALRSGFFSLAMNSSILERISGKKKTASSLPFS